MVQMTNIQAFSWLSRLISGLSLRTPGLSFRPIHVGFEVDKVALGLQFPLATSFHQYLVLILSPRFDSQPTKSHIQGFLGAISPPKYEPDHLRLVQQLKIRGAVFSL
jgi:hypothetical protein